MYMYLCVTFMATWPDLHTLKGIEVYLINALITLIFHFANEMWHPTVYLSVENCYIEII